MRPSLAALLVPALLALTACDPVPGEPTDREETEAVCYDGLDNDVDGAADCADDECAGWATCCIGTGAADCCEALAPIFSASFEACADGAPLASCVPELTPFGEPDPGILDGALTADGESYADNGAVLLSPVDPLASELRVIFEAATADRCSGGCVNYVGVGLVPLEGTRFDPSAEDGGDPNYGGFSLLVVLRPGRGDGAVLVYGEPIATFDVPDGYHHYALNLGPGGASLDEVDASGAVLSNLVPVFEPVPKDPLWLAVIGRNNGLDEGSLPARVRSVSVERGACDMPQRGGPDAEPVIPAPGSAEAAVLTDVEGVGRARNAAGVEAVVIDAGDAFHLFRRGSTGTYAPTRALSEPIVTTAGVPGLGATTIDDPWLVADEAAARWQLYFTVHTGSNASVIGRISSLPDFADGFDYGTFVVVAEPDAAYPRLEQPTVLDDLMVARASNASLGILVRLQREGADRWGPVGGGAVADGRIHTQDPDELFAMDRDEVADPALVEVDGVYRLYFAGRRGTRWMVGLLASVGGEYWYQPLDLEPVWELDDAGFDALGALDPAPLTDDGLVDLLFVGTNGYASQVGHGVSGTTVGWPLP